VTTSPSSSAQQAREALGRRLREIRKSSGLTARALAELAGWHETKCSQLQAGKRPPSEDDIRMWARLCGAEDQIDDLIATARNVEGMYVEWRRLEQTGLARLQRASVGLLEETRHFKIYCSSFMPGVLQAAQYITALLTMITEFRGIPNDVDEAVAARLDRSKVVRQGDHRFSILVEEAVLRYRIGDDEAMVDQLAQLLASMSLPSVSLRIIPDSARRTMWPLETFIVYDDKLVTVELLSAHVRVTTPTDVDGYVRAFSELSKMAVYGKEARSLIMAAMQVLE
jgi:transcriptional regulator with XRE-family HTH domain